MFEFGVDYSCQCFGAVINDNHHVHKCGELKDLKLSAKSKAQGALVYVSNYQCGPSSRQLSMTALRNTNKQRCETIHKVKAQSTLAYLLYDQRGHPSQ